MATFFTIVVTTLFLVTIWAFIDQIFNLVELSFAYFRGKNHEA